MSSNTLRRALSASSANSEASSNAETGASGGFVKKQYVSSSSTLTNKTNTPPDSIITEHRKRPNGDGYTVHQYMRGKLLGKGGFAKVYQVTSLDTNKIYAAKIVPKANLVKNRARQKVRVVMLHARCCAVTWRRSLIRPAPFDINTVLLALGLSYMFVRDVPLPSFIRVNTGVR